MSRWGAVVLVAMATACGRGPTHEYPAEVVDNFVGACRTRAPEETCRCAIDRLQDDIPYETFRSLEQRMAEGAMPDEIAAAVRGCVPS